MLIGNSSMNICPSKFSPPSHALLIVYKIWLRVFFVLTSITFSTCLYVIIRHSPIAMREYRKYMIWNSSQAFTTIIALNIAELVSIFPCPAALITGPARYFQAYFGLPAEWVEISLFLGNTMAYTYISMVMFLYRHQQLSDGWLKCYMEQNRYALPGNAIGMAVGMILIVTSLIGYVNGSDVMKGIFGSIIENATDVQNVTVIGVLALPILTGIVLFAEISAGALCSLICSYKIYKYLQVFKPSLSPTTYNLYKMLINALVLEMITIHVFLYLPVSITAILFVFESEFSSTAFILNIMSVCVFCPLYNVITLGFISPYRKAILGFLKNAYAKIIGNRETQVINMAQQGAISFSNTTNQANLLMN